MSVHGGGGRNASALDELGLRPISRDDLLGHLRPVHQYRVDSLPVEVRDGLELRRYLVSGARRNGVDVRISLRLFLRRPADPRIVLTLPGGAGRVDDKLIEWLARYFDANHAIVDWVGRGQSGDHEGLRGSPDPLFMEGDTFRDCFQFYNLSGIWTALNWLFHAGFRPTDLVGGSWGGVYCFLLSALDDRIERIFPSFGCGGFAFPGIEKRSYWDAAIEYMGPARFAEWCAAFDPIARIGGVKAEVFFETATNDKFFSLDMAMQTWRRLQRPAFLTFAHNQDHSMQLNGLHPYVLQTLPKDSAVLERARAATRTALHHQAPSNAVTCSPAERSGARLVLSEQLPARGDMSREWRPLESKSGPETSARFEVTPTHSDTRILYYLEQEIPSNGRSFKAATPLHGGMAAEFTIGRAVPLPRLHCLLDARSEPLADAPIGDKTSPRMAERTGTWSLVFTGQKRLRATRFGIRPWLLPPDWTSICVELAEAIDERSAGLHLVLSRMYNRRDEQACSQLFGGSEAARSGQNWIYRFHRAGFARVGILDGRFGIKDFFDGSDITASFDAVGILDKDGAGPVAIRLVSITVE